MYTLLRVGRKSGKMFFAFRCFRSATLQAHHPRWPTFFRNRSDRR